MERHKHIPIMNCSSHDNKGSPGNVAIIKIGDRSKSYGFRKIHDKGTEELLGIHLIGPKVAKALIDAGITNIEQLAKADPNIQLSLPKIFQSQLPLMIGHAKAIKEKRIIITGIPPIFKEIEGKNIYFFDSEYNTIPQANLGMFMPGWGSSILEILI